LNPFHAEEAKHVLDAQKRIILAMMFGEKPQPSQTAAEITNNVNLQFGTHYRPHCVERYLVSMTEHSLAQRVDPANALVQTVGTNGSQRFSLTRLGLEIGREVLDKADDLVITVSLPSHSAGVQHATAP
jgi:hypothetical protein